MWFTRLSGSGKSTIANCISKKLIEFNYSVITLDGDEIRNSVHVHLGFSPVDILENNKKIAIICKDLLQNHDFILVPIISPFRKTRLNAKKIIGKSFVEVYIKSNGTFSSIYQEVSTNLRVLQLINIINHACM